MKNLGTWTLAVLLMILGLVTLAPRQGANAQTLPLSALLRRLGLGQLPDCSAMGINRTYLFIEKVGNTGTAPTYDCAFFAPGITITGQKPTVITDAGASPLSFTYGEVPGGAIDGVNAVFTLAAAPNPAGSLTLYQNIALATGYTQAGNTITFTNPPAVGDILMAVYRTQ
jgi:hypothetical protein